MYIFCILCELTNNHDIFHINGVATLMTLMYLYFLVKRGIPKKVYPLERASAETSVSVTCLGIMIGLTFINTYVCVECISRWLW